MQTDYFRLAKKLNELHQEKLAEKQAHFRGNANSCSLVSLNDNTPEIGVSGITQSNAHDKLTHFTPQKPGRSTPEKRLQSSIIRRSLTDKGILPFGEEKLTFVTSEFAATTSEGKKVVNDILAINAEGDFVVIELKSSRDTKVLVQTLAFKEFIESERAFFNELAEQIADRTWSGKVRCVAVWPKANRKARPVDENYQHIAIYGYDSEYHFTREK